MYERKGGDRVVDPRRSAFEPDYAVPPGETLRETLDFIGMSQAELARRADLSTKHVNQIIQGEAPITPETSLAFERVTEVPARMWNSLEANYQSQRIRVAQRRRLESADLAWLKRFPITELVRREAIAGSNDSHVLYDQVLRFFGVASRHAWGKLWAAPEVAFRQSAAFRADQFAVASWLRLGEIEATEIETTPFNRAAFRDALSTVRTLMTLGPARFFPAMVEACAQAGVALVLVQEVKGARASGATQWLSSTRALMQLSLRYRWEDHFWFSFFHEGAHVYLHGKRRAFVDGPGGAAGVPADAGVLEDEANRFAADFLIPRARAPELKELEGREAIVEFSESVGIPPGIVVGRMQREGMLPWNSLNDLRRRFVLKEM
jgi:HTH-type transcriptional regulator/antitoxin HigA